MPTQPGAMPQMPSMQQPMRPPAQATQPGMTRPTQPGMPQAPSMQQPMRPPAQATQPGMTMPMRPPAQAQPSAPGTPGVAAPGAPMPPTMSPANSAALQQILEQASGIFPAQADGLNPSVQSPSSAAGNAPRGARTTEEWQREVDELLQDSMPRTQTAPSTAPEPVGRRQSIQHPFPGQFPNSEWMRVEMPNGDEYFEGVMQRGNERFVITAVPGEYRTVPPSHLQRQGFGRFIPSRNGGCWVRVQKE